MAGGMHREGQYGVPIGIRAGLDIPPPVWEQAREAIATPPPREVIAPRDRHVWAYIIDEWVQALAIEVRRDVDDSWRVRVAYVLAGGVVHEEWVPLARVTLERP